ncbi:MAG TPA: hypothetical protein VGI22_24080 [Xanthobacteraceae bacterium]|jgi:hypothetical protein
MDCGIEAHILEKAPLDRRAGDPVHRIRRHATEHQRFGRGENRGPGQRGRGGRAQENATGQFDCFHLDPSRAKVLRRRVFAARNAAVEFLV